MHTCLCLTDTAFVVVGTRVCVLERVLDAVGATFILAVLPLFTTSTQCCRSHNNEAQSSFRDHPTKAGVLLDRLKRPRSCGTNHVTGYVQNCAPGFKQAAFVVARFEGCLVPPLPSSSVPPMSAVIALLCAPLNALRKLFPTGACAFKGVLTHHYSQIHLWPGNR